MYYTYKIKSALMELISDLHENIYCERISIGEKVNRDLSKITQKIRPEIFYMRCKNMFNGLERNTDRNDRDMNYTCYYFAVQLFSSSLNLSSILLAVYASLLACNLINFMRNFYSTARGYT